MLESNSPRNTQPETHRTDEVGRRGSSSPLLFHCLVHIGTIDFLMPEKTHRGCRQHGWALPQMSFELLWRAIVQGQCKRRRL